MYVFSLQWPQFLLLTNGLFGAYFCLVSCLLLVATVVAWKVHAINIMQRSCGESDADLWWVVRAQAPLLVTPHLVLSVYNASDFLLVTATKGFHNAWTLLSLLILFLGKAVYQQAVTIAAFAEACLEVVFRDCDGTCVHKFCYRSWCSVGFHR
jgi:hypothetical protein